MQPMHRNETDLTHSNNAMPTTTTTTIQTPQTMHANGGQNGKEKLQNGGQSHNNNSNGNNNKMPAAPQQPPQHNNTNGHHMNGYQNGLRRDSTQAWTPLLSNGNKAHAEHGEHTNGSAKTNGDVAGNGMVLGGVVLKAAAQSALDDTATLLYNCAVPNTNNNELKATEDMKNLKNGLLHHAHAHTHAQGNNNGSMMNGKNGHGLSDKYANEQDPLTGLYRKRASESDDSDFDSDLNANDAKTPSCGLFGCRPSWARRFASTHVFMLVFLLAYILQGMYMTYFVSVITTIEKLFQIKSKTTGFLLSASEMGQISTAMLLTYFAGRGHRPRWIACGMVLFSIAAFACALPHFIFGDQLIKTNALLNSKYGSAEQTLSESIGGNMAMSLVGGRYNDTSSDDGLRTLLSNLHQDINLCRIGDNATAAGEECNEDRKLEQASHTKITAIVLCIFFASLLSSGIGQTAVATLGIPYIDDNVASKQSPMYMAITIGVRILGPASGFIVGSFCTRWYVNLSNPGFDPTDQRWIGAWWLGPVIIGSLMLLASIAMFSFPKQLRGKRPIAADASANGSEHEGSATSAVAVPAAPAEPEEKPKLKDFPKTVRRQLSNDILMFRTASCVFHLLPIAGLYTFLPKYLETQFRLQTYDANMIAAFCGILVMGVGIVISGLVILKLKPSARAVAAWIALTALIYSMGMVILMFIGCNMNDFAGYKPSTSNAPASIEPACSAALNCTCDMGNFAPICGLDNRIYISACHAGCTTTKLRDSDNRTAFTDCACITDIDPKFSNESYVAVNGYCDVNCKNYIYFILIFVVCVFIHSTSEVGSMLLVMRCTHPKDKAMAMGVIQSAIGLFGNVPCPIIYGAVVDSACLLWKSVCGKHGACSLYDADSFRNYFLGITAGIMFLAFIMDVIVFTKAHRIDIAPEENNDAQKPNDTESAEAMAPPDTTV